MFVSVGVGRNTHPTAFRGPLHSKLMNLYQTMPRNDFLAQDLMAKE